MNETVTFVAALAAGLAGALYLTRKLWRFGKMIEALAGLAERELTPNGGGSLHDKITRTDAEMAETKQLLEDHLVVAQRDSDSLADVRRHLGLD